MKIFSNDDIRAIDRATIDGEGVSAAALIERVAQGVAKEIMSRWQPEMPTAVFAGPGNNGADALAVARILATNGWSPVVYLFNINGNRLSADCAEQKAKLLAAFPDINLYEVVQSFSMPDINHTWLVVDGLFGSGLRDVLPGGFQSVVRNINESRATVVSIDVPSGLFAEWNATNSVRNIIHATLTVTVQFPRLAFLLEEAGATVGEWVVLNIGLSRNAIKSTPTKYFLVDHADVSRMLLPRQQFCDKNSFGSLLLAAGSYGMMGAANLAAKGAMRSGVGRLTVHSCRAGYNIMQTSVPEALFSPDKNELCITELPGTARYSAIAAGPGIGVNEKTISALEALIASSREKPLVLDADALNCIARRPALLNMLPPMSVITPHAREFDRLFGERINSEDRLLKAMEMARTYRIVIVLKGRFTAVVRPDGIVSFNSSGTPAMATAGSGDVLTGIIGSLLAQGYRPDRAAIAGVYIHGVAGELAAARHGDYGVTAGDIASMVGRAIQTIIN